MSETVETVLHFQSKHLEFRQTYSAACHMFNSVLGVWHPNETLSLVFDIERFSIECRKTKTRVITLANHKGHIIK